jgi:hypothetical protein
MAAVAVAAPVLVFGQAGDASKVMADLQKALGGADKVGAVKSLTATGMIQRVTPRGTIENAVEVSIEMPDKYLARTVVGGQGDMSIYRNAGFNGDGLLNRVDAPPNLAGNSRLSDRVAAAGRTGAEQTPEQQAAILARQMLVQKKDFARLVLGMLGTSTPAFPLTFTYIGEAEATDGSAHVIGVHGPEGFEAQFFVSTKTNLPLMLTWSDTTAGAAPRTIEYRIFYSNVGKAGNLKTPHTFQRTADGKITDETTYSEIQVNPKIDPKTFAIAK